LLAKTIEDFTMATSTEYLTQVSNLYVALFNRAPDTEGMKFWSEALANGASLSAVTSGFLTAPEGQAIYTPTQTGSEFVAAFYQTVFGRAPDANGLAFWLSALESAGGVGSAEARVFLVNGLVNVVSTPMGAKPDGMSDADYAATVNDRAMFGNKVAYATFVGTYADSTVTPGAKTSLAAITADPASVTAAETSFGQPTTPTNPGGGGTPTNPGGGGTPTDPVDATPIVGTEGDDQLIVADAASFTKTGFSVDGLDGNDMLVVQKATGAIDATDKIAGVEAVKFTTTGATTIDATHFSGVSSFGSLDAGASLAVSNLAEGQTTSVTGTNVDTSFGFNETATAAALTLEDAQGGAVHVTGAALTSLTVTAGGAEGGAGSSIETLDVTGTAVTAITIDAGSAVALGSITGVTGGTLTVTGGAQVGIDAVSGITAVDASANTAGIRINDLASATSFIGTESADILGISGTTGVDATIKLGAGDDQLAFAVGTVFDQSGLTVTLGEGADTIDVSALTLGEGSPEGMAATVVTIADFGAGDKIVFSAAESTNAGAITVQDLSVNELVYEAATAALQTAANASTSSTIAAFTWGNDTYLIADTEVDGAYGVGDVLVKLTGIVDMSSVTLEGNTVVFAAALEPVAA
jgi:hypothetical protein